MEDNGISDCQLVGINDNLTGVVDNGIQCQAPVLVADYALTVLTSRFGVVAVAMIRDWIVVRHEFLWTYTKVGDHVAPASSTLTDFKRTAHHFNSLTKSIRTDNVPNRTIGLCATVLYKQRMFSST